MLWRHALDFYVMGRLTVPESNNCKLSCWWHVTFTLDAHVRAAVLGCGNWDVIHMPNVHLWMFGGMVVWLPWITSVTIWLHSKLDVFPTCQSVGSCFPCLLSVLFLDFCNEPLHLISKLNSDLANSFCYLCFFRWKKHARKIPMMLLALTQVDFSQLTRLLDVFCSR